MQWLDFTTVPDPRRISGGVTMGGGGTPEFEITLISPESPVSNYAGESRIFKASVN